LDPHAIRAIVAVEECPANPEVVCPKLGGEGSDHHKHGIALNCHGAPLIIVVRDHYTCTRVCDRTCIGRRGRGHSKRT
jgi:hypothetical protein